MGVIVCMCRVGSKVVNTIPGSMPLVRMYGLRLLWTTVINKVVFIKLFKSFIKVIHSNYIVREYGENVNKSGGEWKVCEERFLGKKKEGGRATVSRAPPSEQVGC